MKIAVITDHRCYHMATVSNIFKKEGSHENFTSNKGVEGLSKIVVSLTLNR